MRSAVSAMQFFRDPEAYAKLLAGGDPVTWLHGARTHFVLVRDPDAIWKVLVSDAGTYRVGRWKLRARRVVAEALNTLDGDAHRERRRLIGPSLNPGRIADRSASIAERAERMQAGWQDGATIVAREHMQRLSVCVVGELLFSTDLEPAARELAPALARVSAALPHRMPPQLIPGRRQALQRARDVVRELVGNRLRTPDSHEDMLSALLGAGLPASVVHGEVLAMLIAAVSEPPRALEAAWLLLAQAPDAERRLHDEVRRESAEDRLPYLDAVVKETLRLLPPVRHVDRRPVGSAVIADQRVGPSTHVIVSPVVTHRDPALYASPEEFRPDRWLTSEGEIPRGRGAYLPFGAGHHACIGAALGRTIISLTLATVARQWRLRPVPGTRDPRRAPMPFRLERW